MIFGHEKVALELSGGKDSVACLFRLKDHLDQVTVYWLNTGDPYPETVEVIDRCRKMCPNFVEVKADVKAWKRLNGMPSDVIPITGEQVHLPEKRGEVRCVDAYTCCLENIMLPLHKRVVEDGNTLIIRGQRDADEHKGPLRSGDWIDGLQMIYPIEGWTDEEVIDYLISENAPIHPVYEHGFYGVDCLHCTAWWGKTNLRFLSRHKDALSHVLIARNIVRKMVSERMESC